MCECETEKKKSVNESVCERVWSLLVHFSFGLLHLARLGKAPFYYSLSYFNERDFNPNSTLVV